MPLKLACADFTFPLLPHNKVLQLIAMLDVQDFPVLRQWYIAYQRDKQLPRVATAFIEFARGQLLPSEAVAGTKTAGVTTKR